MKKYILTLAALAFLASSCVKDEVYKPEGESEEVDYSGLVINEIDGNGKFVELFNMGAEAIPLKNVILQKNESGQWWKGDATATIQPGGFYTIAQAGGSAGANEYTGDGGISAKKTVKFALFIPGVTAEKDSYYRTGAGLAMDANCAPDYAAVGPYSYARCPDGTGDFGLATPSINAANPATAAGAIVTTAP